MAEKDEKEKDSKNRDARGGDADRDVRSVRVSAESERGRDYDDDDDDRGSRRDARDTGRSVRRASNDFLTFGCDLLGDLFIGVGEALTPRRRRSSSSRSSSSDDDRGNCWDQYGFEVRTYNRSDRDTEDDESNSGSGSGSGSKNRVRSVRYESR